MANNPKVDSIVAPVAKEKEEQPVFSPQETEAPLFVPAEPEVPQIKAKKESIWFKDLVGEDKPKTPKPPKAPKVPKEPKVKAEKVPKAPKMKIHHKIAAWIVLAVFLFVTSLSLAGGAYAHQEIYKNKVFPGVVVWGENVGGKSTEEVQKIITDKIQNYKINLAGPDQNYTATADDLGLVFDSETIALSAFSKGRTSSFWDNYFTRARLMLAQVKWKYMQKAVRSTDLEIEPKFTVDDKKLDEYLAKVSDNIKIVPQDSKVTVESGNIKLVPAIYGREVEKSNLKEVLLAAIKDFRSSKINIQTKEIKPNIVDKAAEEVRVQTEGVISRPVNLTYQGQSYRPDRATVASWISFTKASGATNYTMVVDPAKMTNYFNFLGSKINIYSIPKKVRVENGVKQTVTQEGKDGLLVDTKALGQQISQQLPTKAEVSLVIPTYVSPFKTEYENVIVENWDKYIDINISTQTMTAYLKGGTVVGSWAVTTGNRYHPTPIGTWLVIGKSAVTTMSGGTPGVDYYNLPGVHWVTWFKGGGYSIHEAYWRSSFGGQDYLWNGSHGCVNSPYAVAQFIFDWAPVGTPVIVHY